MRTNVVTEILEEHGEFAGAVPLVDIPGLSSPRVCHLLNHLVRRMDAGESYLEIGTWKGLTLLSAALGNFGRACIGCDKFRFWGKFTGPGVLARRALYGNLRRYRGRTADIIFFPMRYERLFARRLVSSPVGVYFYDGDHSARGTRAGVVLAAPFLAERCVLVMDDWSDPIIRDATTQGLRDAGLDVLWHRALPGNEDRELWWNGLGVFHLRKTPEAPRLDRGPR
ncbi:MAG: class I SAM-dependent methyltransferase [Deltaproteobacteria bacterium]|nr:class I SAM-dependent methyltransferase [Deltaproteobacteria bacterium]